MNIIKREQTLTRLQRGQVVELFGAEYVVVMANDCRARCLPFAKRAVDYNTRFGKNVAFETSGTPQNISPESAIPILRWLTEAQMIEAKFVEAKTI